MRLVLLASALVVVLAVPYLLLALRRRGWAQWRTGVYLASCALLWWCLAGTPATLRHRDPVWGVIGVAVADVLVGFGLVVAAPVRLWEETRGRRVGWLRNPLVLALGFPLVSATLNGALLVAAFSTSWFTGALSDDTSWTWLLLACLLGGFVANLQLLSPDLVPAWITPGPRMVLALADGLLDELPGIIVMVVTNQVWGGVLWVTAQPVVVPMMALILLDWFRHERSAAQQIDATLDAIDAAGGNTTTPWWVAGDPDAEGSGVGSAGSTTHPPGD